MDFSDTSGTALRYAVVIATWFRAELHVLHVVDVAAPTGSVELFWDYLRVIREERLEIRNRIREFLEPAEVAGVLTTIDIEEGFAVEQILEHAAAFRTDMIVMGTRGLSGITHFMLGSTAEQVLRTATCPVLTVAPHAERTPPSSPALFSRMLCPVSFSDASLKGLEAALSLAQGVGGRVMLLHALDHAPKEEGNGGVGFQAAMGHQFTHVERNVRYRFRRLIPAEAWIWCDPAQTIIVADSPARAILRAALDTQADLVVMGLTQRNAIERMLFGSTTEAVVREATCPVLTIRAR